mmetsp:Transcript_117607/g.374702  ORF Transcript_117607/g.374702 Transcript_117607/m.374702 type:complete len:423 (-) Transcript_117607:102-1370(-)
MAQRRRGSSRHRSTFSLFALLPLLLLLIGAMLTQWVLRRSVSGAVALALRPVRRLSIGQHLASPRRFCRGVARNAAAPCSPLVAPRTDSDSDLSGPIQSFADEHAGAGGVEAALVGDAARRRFVSDLDGDSSLVIPALLRTRDMARQRKNYALADSLREHIRGEFDLEVQDLLGGGSMVLPISINVEDANTLGAEIRELARGALEASMTALDYAEVELAATCAAAAILERLSSAPPSRPVLQGRQHSDVALTMALAGSDNVELFGLLAEGAADELERTAKRTPPLAAAQLAERCAAAGLRPQDCPRLFGRAAVLLRQGGGFEGSSTLRDLEDGIFSLLSERPLRWLFRHSTRQGRRCVAPSGSGAAEQAVEALNRAVVGPDGSRPPLVLDLGCGFGVSSLGMAFADPSCSVLAVDASAHCIG